MKNSWINWAIIISILVIIVIGINYQNSQNKISLDDVFKEEEKSPAEMDYEYVDNAAVPKKATPTADKQVEPVLKTTVAKKETAVKEISTVAPVASSVKPSEVPSSSLEAIPFTIQVLSSKDQNKAEKKLEEIKKKGYDAFISAKDLGDKGLWYRVYVGKFNTKQEAEAQLNKVQADYPGSFIISPK